MKLINKILVFLSLNSLVFSALEAKSIEFILDHKVKKTIDLQINIPEQKVEQPFGQTFFLPCYQQLKIENLGDQPIQHCFPYVNQPPSFSLEELSIRLAKEQYPLLALYQFWKNSIFQDESIITETNCHPLDLLNFKGACSPISFNLQFLKLCNALGIETRLANVQGKEVYDFEIGDEWSFLDLVNQQLYLRLDNERLASSEDVMDDPFLALRTKHGGKDKQVDFKEAWKELAAFDILEPASAKPVAHPIKKSVNRCKGIDLYPKETLLFETPLLRPELAPYECAVDHIVNLESRTILFRWKYRSSFPIYHLINNSTTVIRLVDQKVELQPGQSFEFKEGVFQIKMAFASRPKGKITFSGTCSWKLFPSLLKGKNHIHLGTKKNASNIRFHYELNEKIEKESAAIRVCNQENFFDNCSPYFMLEASAGKVEKIWWQIGTDKQFQLVPSNFDQVEDFTSIITLSPINETFLNPETTYYFRAKGYSNGKWGDWSSLCSFSVKKPSAVEEVLFEQINDNEYELNWERYAERVDGSIEYLVFGSNSLDFIPSIYCDKQVNAIINGEFTEEEKNDNLIAITTEPKIRIKGGLAYYRIIARQNAQLSVPSTIIHVYDQELIQPRNVLQVVKEGSQILAKRQLFPISYPSTETFLPHVSALGNQKSKYVKFQSLLRSLKNFDKTKNYEYESPNISEAIWQEVRPYLLPENHPAWPKLNRVFCKIRATQSPDHFKKAGFRRWRPGRWSRVSASSHPEFPEYFIKAYCDVEVGIIYDWKKWIHRIEGAECIRSCIKQYNLQDNFKVPHKWIYPLPKNPSPPNSSRYARKNFILVCENMRIEDHHKNEKMYKKNITRNMMKGLYTILQVCGLYDSVYVFNMPFCKDGRIAIIDTEYHHKWPVPFHKLTSYFAKSLQTYWQKITFKGGKIPDGVSRPNPPRMDRRDIRR